MPGSRFDVNGRTATLGERELAILDKLAVIAEAHETAPAGIALAWVMYILRPDLPRKLAKQFPQVYFFLLNKWYFDELYDRIFVRPIMRLASVSWRIGDATLIDGVPNGLAAMAAGGARQAVKVQTGSLAAYAFVMLIGVVVLVGVFMFFR